MNDHNEIEVVDSGVPLPQISAIKPLLNNRLRVTWSDGLRAGITEEVDLSPALASYKVYRALRDNKDLFSTARLLEDGDVVAWDGPDLEMFAELIQELAEFLSV